MQHLYNEWNITATRINNSLGHRKHMYSPHVWIRSLLAGGQRVFGKSIAGSEGFRPGDERYITGKRGKTTVFQSRGMSVTQSRIQSPAENRI